MRLSGADVVERIRTGLRQIGYMEDLLPRAYAFADFTSDDYALRTVDLAAFAQQPPSYRNACFGVVLAAENDRAAIRQMRALGAPQILAVEPSGLAVHRWKIVAEGDPVHEEVFPADEILAVILDRREVWGPDPVLRMKSRGVYTQEAQRDLFYDTGLLPVLEREVHKKLDQLFGETLTAAVQMYEEEHGSAPDREATRGLFRLLFRLLAAKLLNDRGHEGNWDDPDVERVIQAVEAFYYRRGRAEPVLPDRLIQQIAWDRIRTGFRLQNLSVEALAYVYENTFVGVETRRRYDTHATPYEIAEYVLARLPIEDLPPDERTVFEPFAGHAPFLTAALGRLRALLPPDTDRETRHDYLVRMLRGMEVDAFAREVSYASLILADYPNSNGWQLEEGDVFNSPDFAEALARARVVVCNPPYGDFSATERAEYEGIGSTNKAVEALRRVMEQPPEMLGFLLPRPVTHGQMYRAVRREVVRRYANVELVALPDVIFRHSGIDTALLLAYGRRDGDVVWRSAQVRKADYERFIRTGEPSWEFTHHASPEAAEAADPVLWRAPLLQELVEATEHLASLGEVAEIHRGVEYRDAVENHVRVKRPAEAGEKWHQGLHRKRDRLAPLCILGSEWLEIDPPLMLYKAHERAWNAPKVIANAARASRSAWTVSAAVDHTGLYCTQNFHGIWPRSEFPLEVIAAVVNGPLANAWIELRRGSQRHNTKGMLASIPLPLLSQAEQGHIVDLVAVYEERVEGIRRQAVLSEEDRADLRDMLSEIDAAVLSGYDLPDGVEHMLLDFFGDAARPGAAWFRGYAHERARKTSEERLRELADLWFDDTEDLSSYTDIVRHPAYQQVIRRFGRSAVAFLLGELERGRVNWVWALREITAQNPVTREDRQYLDRVAKSWVRWGYDNGIR